MSPGSNTCTCGRDMVSITMATPEAPVTLKSCFTCDRLDWQVDGSNVTRSAALAQLAKTGRR
jgi:hypothetical protein